MSVVAKILEQRTFTTPGKLKVTEYFFGGIPRDWTSPEAGSLKLFARSVRKSEKPADPSPEEDEKKKQLPWMVYLQGGPGFECSAPQNWAATHTVLDRGYQMLFLDQRGTGLSTPLAASTLGLLPNDRAKMDYLRSFRADSIVKDCEAIRKCLTADFPEEKKKWSIMGQSFGGFCATTYLSMFPEGLREAFVFGGLPPLVKDPDPVYERTWKKVAQRNEAYYNKFPEDVERVRKIVEWLRTSDLVLPSGGTLTPRRFQQLGIVLGFHGGVDDLHEIVLRASNELDLYGHLTRQTQNRIEQWVSFDDNLLYSMLHEPIYSQGKGSAANWSAHRVQKLYFHQFDVDTSGPIYFTGEMIFPWMFEDYFELRKVKGAADLLATADEWPDLYDEKQLAANTVPVYAAVYYDDMYVDYDFSMETARKIKGCKTYITNQMYHNALRSKMAEVTGALFNLRDDEMD
ncbi:proline iminopeptidase [Rhizodiscina lignyota]|uniref:Proline iminopeptidase n=1 Tax=Rhizodiscina lignyota TaxID=1504668 RepID=A0A9P4IA90_9PEZI|nr:proline iminopeptidase [Rhizodiscina lignyota]